MMGTRVTRGLTSLVAIALALVGLTSISLPARAAGAFCSLTGMVTNTWTGGAGDGLWNTGGNWSRGVPPTMLDKSTGYVCIDAHARVLMAAGESAEIQAIDVAAGTTLYLATGSMLYVWGDPATRPSVFRQGSVVQMRGTLGGQGRYDLEGLMNWTSTTFGAATMTSRRCGVGGTCGAPVTGTLGQLVVNDTGFLDVNDRGVNLVDQYRLKVSGTLRLRNNGYVAADRGTGLELVLKTTTTGRGTLLIANDGGWYEGRTLYGLTALTTVSNGGLIRKSAGTGSSIIDATYTKVGTGAVRVDSGTLALPSGVVQRATVGSSDTYGLGACDTKTYGCAPVADTTAPQGGALTVPASDATGASVLLALDGPGPSGTIGQEMHATATGLTVTTVDPAILQLRYDASILGGKTVSTITVQRQPEGGTIYTTVPACTSTGEPPTGSVSCVDRRGLATSSRMLPDGDALMVVRTTGFSRWVAR